MSLMKKNMNCKSFVLHGLDDIVTDESNNADFLYIGLYVKDKCNLKCIYCYNYDQEYTEPNLQCLTLGEQISVISNASELGAKVLFIAGFGEPLLDQNITDIVIEANKHNLLTVIYTNGTIMDKKLARFFYNHNSTIVVKLESINPKLHDALTQVKGSHEKAMETIDILLRNGYNTENIMKRIGVATLYTLKNIDEIPRVYKWACKKKIAFKCDLLGFYGRAAKHKDELLLRRDEILRVRKETPGESSYKECGCLFWNYGITIDNFGYARYCSEKICTEIGNIRKKSLKQILEEKNRKYPGQKGIFSCPLKEIFLE